MIRTRLYDTTSGKMTEGDIAQVERFLNEPATRLWIDLDDEEDAAERELLLQTFGLHPLAVQDALRDRHPPKIESFDNATFILLRGLSADTQDIDFGVIQLALFVSDRLFVTRHRLPSASVDWLWEQTRDEPASMNAGCDDLAVRLMNRVVRRFVDVLLGLETRLDELESEIFARPRDALLSELTRYKSRLKQLRRIANYHLQIAAQLRSAPGEFFSSDLSHDIVDVYEQLDRSLSLADLYYEQADDLISGYLAMSSHKLNQIMQVLTIFTVIFVPLTFLAGIYGMNFENMPELHSEIGYLVVLGAMGIIVVCQIAFLKYKKWL